MGGFDLIFAAIGVLVATFVLFVVSIPFMVFA